MRALLTALALAWALAFPAASWAAEEAPDPFRGYDGKEPVPEGLRQAYAGFARAARDGGVESFCLPHAVTVSRQPRQGNSKEYGQDLNLPFLRDGFSPAVRVVRKDSEDCYLVRTDTSALWFVRTGSGAWKVYRYLDKPIE